MNFQRRLPLLLFLTSACLSACGGSGPSPVTAPSPALVSRHNPGEVRVATPDLPEPSPSRAVPTVVPRPFQDSDPNASRETARAILQASAAHAARVSSSAPPASPASSRSVHDPFASGVRADDVRLVAAATPPGVPLIQVSVNGTSVTITWTPSSSGDAATSFVLRYSGPGGIAGQQTVSNRTLAYSGLPPGQYQIQVCATNSAGTACSVPAAGEFTIVNAPTVPDPPTQLAYRLDGGLITISWLIASTGAPAVTMVVIAEGLGEFPVGLSGGITTAGPMPPGTYVVRVLARNASGDSVAAGPISIVVPCTPLAAPQLSKSVSGSSVTLTWTSGSPKIYTSSYLVAISGPSPSQVSVGAGTLSYTASSLQPGDYTATVQASSGGSCGGGAVATVSFTIGATTQATFTGSFDATGPNTSGSCAWDVNYNGSATLNLTLQPDGLTLAGTLRVSGNYNATARSSSCKSDSGTFADTKSISGTVNRFTASGLTIDFSGNGSFSGSVLSTTLAIGTLTVNYPNGVGSVACPITFRR